MSDDFQHILENGISFGRGGGKKQSDGDKVKTKAKKKAAFMVLVRLMKSAGLGSEELEKAMWETMEG